MILEACVYLYLLFFLKSDSLREKKKGTRTREKKKYIKTRKRERKSEREKNANTYKITMRAIHFF